MTREQLEAELARKKLHLEYLRCAIADTLGVEGMHDDMSDLWKQMDETTKRMANRDVAPLSGRECVPKIRNSARRDTELPDVAKKFLEEILDTAAGLVEKAHRPIVCDTNEEVERRFTSHTLRIMAQKVETKKELKGFTMDWETGKDINITEKIVPSVPTNFIFNTVTLKDKKDTETESGI
jgi:hypothetical protein